MSLVLQKQLKELESKLNPLPSSKDALLKLLKLAASCLSELEQSPSALLLEQLQPFFEVIANPELLNHPDKDVKLLVATCICEITRITAPEAPYDDNLLRDIFSLIVSTFRGLNDVSGPSFGRRVVILDTLARYRSCIVMLDLECYDLIKEMFSILFSVARSDHPENVQVAMETIMVVLIEESEEIPEDILLVILSNLGHDKKDTNSSARKLAMDVIKRTARKIEPEVKQFLNSSISGERKSYDEHVDYHAIIYDIYHCAPNILLGVIPYLSGELQTDQVDIRLKAVNLVGGLSVVPGSSIFKEFQQIFSDFLKRLTDNVAEVRMVVLEHIRNCLLSNPSRCEAPQIFSALCERLLDFDENVRKQVVSVLCDVACHDSESVPIETLKLVAERLQDKSVLVRNYAMERLAEIYKLGCLAVPDDVANTEFDWIPGKILRCYLENYFRIDTIELILSISMLPSEFSIKNKVMHWIKIFAGFDKVEVKALEKMLERKQSLQQEMRKYLSLRLTSQGEGDSEYQNKDMVCFKAMSRLFQDPLKAEEHFQTLDQMKNANIWRYLGSLLDPDTSSLQANSLRDELLKTLGEDNLVYDFLNTLSIKLSYTLFDKEHVQELLLAASVLKATGNTQLIISCTSILSILALHCPSLFIGTEKELMIMLKSDNELIREGILHVLANAGSILKEQQVVSSSPINLTLETLCMEGSRKQAKYAVYALAAITKDGGLMSLSVLYKRLVDMLDEKANLPVVLQSLGCIAQTAMPVFETRESDIIEFIKSKILSCSSNVEDAAKTSWDDRSELCSLKIFSIKAFVKTYLPFKDVHLRPGIDDLINTLKSLLLYGEISKDIISSTVDKAHLKLASAKAILRLSRCWSENIPVDVFHLVVKSSEVKFPEYKKLFLEKVYQYLKDKVLDDRYACVFVTNMAGSQLPQFEKDKQKLLDVIQMYHQTDSEQLATQNDPSSSISYPAGILPFLIHVLSHHSLPNIDECKDLEAYEQIYRQLYLIISVLIYGYDNNKLTNSVNKHERIAAISSIMLSIQSSEDIVDAEKSKNSHAICDLGISIIKRLTQKEVPLSELTLSVTLPSVLYKPIAKAIDNPNESIERTWLADESSLAHFNSLKLDDPIDDPNIQHSEKASNILLGKKVKLLKSQGSKGKRAKKNSPTSKSKSSNEDVDVLKMVREISSNNRDIPCDGNGPSPSRNQKLDRSSVKIKRPNGIDTTPVRVPKRKRSLTSAVIKSSNSKSSAKISARGKLSRRPVDSSDSGEHLSEEKSEADDTESDLLVSCLNKNGETLKKRSKITGLGSSGRSAKKPRINRTKTSEDVSVSDENGAKSSMGSSKKRKHRSVAVLEKRTAKDDEIQSTDLVGCRIKVWWPLDEEFYEGVVKSYKKKTKEHEIAYDDGDVETLSLHKERWELVDTGAESVKVTNGSKSLKPSERSPKYKSSITKKDNLSKISRPLVLGLRAPTNSPKKIQDKGAKKVKAKSVDSDVNDQLDDLDIKHSKSSDSRDVDNDDSEKDDMDKMQEDEKAEVEKAENNAEVYSEEKLVAYKGPKSVASTSRKGSVKGDEEDEPLLLWKRRVAKKSKQEN